MPALRKRNPQAERPSLGRATFSRLLAGVAMLLAATAWTPAQLMAASRPDPAAHWSFQPIVHSAPPAVRDSSPGITRLDRFLLSRLEAAGLHFSPPSDRRTWIRRATYSLHGLPPTASEIVDFEADRKPDAYERVVDRLLASPRYGERWARHWMDVARYADTKGYVRLNENPKYLGSWAYRDYLVRAFNADLPYDRFVVEQLAADQLNLGSDPRPLAAMGFLTLGQRFLNSRHDILDDRIDVVTRGLLGLTVACARCHDHKFDPVSMRDYYALHGIFDSSVEPRIPPLVAAPDDPRERADYLTGLSERSRAFETYLEVQRQRLTALFRGRMGDYLLAAQKESLQANFLPVMFLVDASKDLNPVITQRWCRLLDRTRKSGHPVLGLWNAVASASDENFPAALEAALASQVSANSLVLASVRSAHPTSLPALAACYGDLFASIESAWQAALKTSPVASHLDAPAQEELRQMMYGPAAPPDIPLTEVEDLFYVDTTTQSAFHVQQRKVEDWIAGSASAVHAQILTDSPVPVQPRVFLRGNAANPGEFVERRFLRILSRSNSPAFHRGSGRLELARAIASQDNPLTARVLVNRVWMHHFGTGLVRTPGDFGTRGEPPTHPELLDELAYQFMQDGWSLKGLHRQILLSAAFRQGSHDLPEGLRRDPENRLLWRMNRRRLDWESLRDSILMASDHLSTVLGGPSVDLMTSPAPARRTLYGFIDRQDLPVLFRSFDFAAPDSCTVQRFETSVPQQALYLLNGPLLRSEARHLASTRSVASPAESINALYLRILGRLPSPKERALGLRFLTGSDPLPNPPDRFNRLEEFIQALLLTNEFAFVD